MSTPESVAFGDPALSDLTLIIGQKEFFVHKMVLASRSDVFKAMFYGYFQEVNQRRIEIVDVHVTAFQFFLEILYDGSVKNRKRLFPSECHSIARYFSDFDSVMLHLLKVADRYNLTKRVVKELKEAFGQIPCRNKQCCRCTAIYLILVERDSNFQPTNVAYIGLLGSGPRRAPIQRRFDRMTLTRVAKEVVEMTKNHAFIDNSKLQAISTVLATLDY